MGRRNRDAARLLLRRLVDLVIGRIGRPARLRQYLGFVRAAVVEDEVQREILRRFLVELTKEVEKLLRAMACSHAPELIRNVERGAAVPTPEDDACPLGE